MHPHHIVLCALILCAKFCLHTDLNHETYECARNNEQHNVLSESRKPEGVILDADGAQDFLEPELFLQHQAFDGHADGVHEGEHQEHGQDASDTLDEAGCRGRQSGRSGLHVDREGVYRQGTV